jgi:hypothetical protein
MRELKASNKNGQIIIARARFNEGYDLLDVYGSFSREKKNAYDWCYEQYQKTEERENFHICSHNTFGFTVAWRGVLNGENILRYETKDNSYLVYMDR